MTEELFNRGIDLMLGGLKYYRWKEPDSRAAYWTMLKDVDDQVWWETVKTIMATEHELPSVATLSQRMKRRRKDLQDCSECDDGRIRYHMRHPENGNIYHRYCACPHCEAGHHVAQHIASLVKKQARMNGHILMNGEGTPSHYMYDEVKKRLAFRMVDPEHKAVDDVDPEQQKKRSDKLRVQAMKEVVIRMRDKLKPVPKVRAAF